MDYLCSPHFDSRTMMGTLPISYYVNVRLNNHLNGSAKIKKATGTKPLHVNFL